MLKRIALIRGAPEKNDKRNSGGTLQQEETKRRKGEKKREEDRKKRKEERIIERKERKREKLVSICIQFSKMKNKYIGRNTRNLKKWRCGSIYNRPPSL